jgi:hypothetical protein
MIFRFNEFINEELNPSIKKKTLTANIIKQTLNTIVDTVSKSGDIYTARRGFYFTNGFTSDKFAEKIKLAINKFMGGDSFELVDSHEIWKPFRGGASTAQNSHWLCKFKINPIENPVTESAVEDEYEQITVDLIKSVYTGTKPEWIEPVDKSNKLILPEIIDDVQEGTIIFNLNNLDVSIEFKAEYELKEGRKGDGYNTPDDQGEYNLSELEISIVDISNSDGSIASYEKGAVIDTAWLLLFKLLPEGNTSIWKKAKDIRNKMKIK